MKLLCTTKPAELPTDALLARLRGRRSEINLSIDIADAPVTSPINWVYRRLNRRLRKRLGPFLDLIALRDLVLALRYTMAGEPPAPALLSDSLLDKSLLKLLSSGRDPDAVVNQLEGMMVDDYPFVAGLAQTYKAQGPGGVEQQLTEGMLQQGVKEADDPFLVRMLRYQVDQRNLLTINKLWRWQVSRLPILVTGGEISTATLRRVWSTSDHERLTELVAKRTGFPRPEGSSIKLEQLLLKGLRRMLRRDGRDPLGLAVIIEYLWMCQLYQHNRVLRQALSSDREPLLQEVLLI